jgi:hypothetical protein
MLSTRYFWWLVATLSELEKFKQPQTTSDEKKRAENLLFLFHSRVGKISLACCGKITCNHRSDQQGIGQNVNQDTHGGLRKKVIYVAVQYACFLRLMPILIPNISYVSVEYLPIRAGFGVMARFFSQSISAAQYISLLIRINTDPVYTCIGQIDSDVTILEISRDAKALLGFGTEGVACTRLEPDTQLFSG